MPKNILPVEFDPTITYPAYLIRNRLLKAIKRHCGKLSGKLLDFGCGVKPYEPLFNVHQYIGVDYNGEGETYSKEKADYLYNGKTLPFESESFDSIFSSEVIEHVFNFSEIILEIRRVLKPGGKILFTCPFTMPEHEMPSDYARYTSSAIKDMFIRNGFNVIAYEKTGNFIESLVQLWIIYIDQNILCLFKNLPVIRTVVRKGSYAFFNLLGLTLSAFLPSSKTLYLNNVIFAEKQIE